MAELSEKQKIRAEELSILIPALINRIKEASSVMNFNGNTQGSIIQLNSLTMYTAKLRTYLNEYEYLKNNPQE